MSRGWVPGANEWKCTSESGYRLGSCTTSNHHSTHASQRTLLLGVRTCYQAKNMIAGVHIERKWLHSRVFRGFYTGIYCEIDDFCRILVLLCFFERVEDIVLQNEPTTLPTLKIAGLLFKPTLLDRASDVDLLLCKEPQWNVSVISWKFWKLHKCSRVHWRRRIFEASTYLTHRWCADCFTLPVSGGPKSVSDFFS